MGFMSQFMDGFLGRPSLPAEMQGERLRAADRPTGFGSEWQPGVLQHMTAESVQPTALQAFVRVAGADVPDEVVAFVFPSSDEISRVVVEQVNDARWGVLTAPVGIIGFGAAGILAGAMAHAADRAMSVWQLDLLINDATAAATFKVQREPDPAALARLSARLGLRP